MERVILSDITIDSIKSYDEKYIEKIQNFFDEAAKSAKQQWLRENGIPVLQVREDLKHTFSVRITFYAHLTDVQATEFYLRF